MRTLTTLLLAGLVAAVAACVGVEPSATPSTQPTVNVTPGPTSSPTPGPTSTPAEPTPSPTSAVPSSTPSAAPGIGQLYEDPEGEYTIRVDPAWEINEGAFAEGIEFWFFGPPEDGFSSNLNVLTQRIGNMTLEEYTQVSIQNAPAQIDDFALIGVDQVRVDGVDLAIMDYTGTNSGQDLHFLAVFTVTEDRAVIATLTTPLASFESWREIVEPYMRTLRPTG
jgi:hypothetical protein